MTTADLSHASELASPAVADPTARVRRRTAVVLGAVAGPLLVAANAWIPSLGESAREAVTTLEADSSTADRFLVAQLAYALASLLFIPLVLVVWRDTAARGRVLRLIGGTLIVIAMVANALSLTLWGYLMWLGARGGADEDSLVRMMTFSDSSAATLPVSFIAIPIAVLGLLVLGAGVLRSGSLPRWAPWLLIVGTVIFAAAQPGVAGLLLGVPFAVGATMVVVLSNRATG